MHGYGYPPGQPPKGRPSPTTLVMLRVTFVALTVLSCGLLAWGSMLRLAIVTRRGRDWIIFALVLALNVGFFVFLGSTPDDPDLMTPAQVMTALVWLLVVVLGAGIYYLVADISHFGPNGPYAGPRFAGPPATPAPAQYGGYAPQRPGAAAPTQPSPGYGHPPAAPQATTAPSPAPRPAPSPAPRPAPSPAPMPQPASPQRLDQVRAELDELSDYLRKEGGSQ